MKNYMIYCFTCVLSGKRYIGYTKNFHKRLALHLKRNSVIGAALRKYGLVNFRITVLLDRLTEKDAQSYEKILIAEFGTVAPLGYNVTEGGLGGNPYVGWTQERRAEHSRRLSKSLSGENNPFYGRQHSAETCRVLSEKLSGKNHPRYGKKLSPEAARKLRESRLGAVASEESRRRMSIAQTGRRHTEESKRKMSGSRRGQDNASHRDNRDRRRGQLFLFDF